MKQDISYRNIFRIALPIVAGSVAQNLINVADTAFLGRVSSVALGAAGNAGILYFLFVFVCMGLGTGAQIIIGRRNGEGNFNLIGPVMDRLLVLLSILSVVLFLFMRYGSPAVLTELVVSPNVLEASNQYLQWRAFAIFFALFNYAFVAFFVGTTRTWILMPATAFTALVNVALDYGLIFGNFGLPAMGIEGAAIASVIAEGATSLLLLLYIWRKVDFGRYQLFKFQALALASFRPIIKIGAPVMLQNFFSLVAWFAFFSIIEHLGEAELAVSHIIRSIYMVMIIPVFGLSGAANTLVSNLIGQGEISQVRPAVGRLVMLGLAAACVFVPFNLLIPEQLIGVFTTDPDLIKMAVPCLYMITASSFLFAASYIQFAAVSGTGNTRMALLIEFFSILLYLIFAWYIAMRIGVPVEIAWSSEFLYFGVMGTIAFAYLKYGKWAAVKV